MPNRRFFLNKSLWGLAILLLSNCMFLGWYISNGIYNRYSIDDYWHGSKIKLMGIFPTLLYHYKIWEGSLTHVFFASFPHIIGLSQRYCFIYNGITFISLVMILYHFFQKYNKGNSNVFLSINLQIALLIVNVFFLVVDSKQEILYSVWLNFTYTFGLVHFLCAIFLYIGARYFLSTIFCILIGFNKINLAIESLTILSIITVYNKDDSNSKYAPVLSIFLALILNIVAPGNFVRRDLIFSENGNLEASLIKIIFDNLQYYLAVTIKELVYSATFFIPILYLLKNKLRFLNKKVTKKSILLFFAITIFFIVFESIFFAIAFNEHGPTRTKLFLEFWIIISTFYLSYSLVLRLKESMTLALTFSFITLYLLKENYYYFQFVNISQNYALTVDKREILIENQISNNRNPILINRLSHSGILNDYYSNDISWINNVYKYYYTNDSTLQVTLK